jgi:cell division protein FtsL
MVVFSNGTGEASMYSLKERINVIDEANAVSSGSRASGAVGVSGTKQMNAGNGASAVQEQQEPSILVAKRRRHLHPFFFHMGPVALSVTSVLLIGLMAVLYLSQVGQAVSDNQKIQRIQAQQSDLQRQDQDLTDTISNEQSPAYIASMARKRGLVPSDPNALQVIKVNNLKPIPNDSQQIQP